MHSRSLLRVCLALLLTVVSCSRTPSELSWWQMRGLVLSTKELAEVDWPALAAHNGINTIGTHITPSEVTAFLATPEGVRFQQDCRRYGICVEHQLHAMGELLPRDLFAQDSTMFRMDTCGRRTPDYNCCVHSERRWTSLPAMPPPLRGCCGPTITATISGWTTMPPCASAPCVGRILPASRHLS